MKTHLLDSSDPIIEGQTQTAICGASVPNAKFVFMWDEIEAGSLITSATFALRICRKCTETPFEKRYIYGIANGEEMKQRERERAAD